MDSNFANYCRVCGLDQEEQIWGEDGKCPTYNICACCGVEFGYGDETPDNCRAIRKHWIEVDCMKWFTPQEKPDDWSWELQKSQIPFNFRDEYLSS